MQMLLFKFYFHALYYEMHFLEENDSRNDIPHTSFSLECLWRSKFSKKDCKENAIVVKICRIYISV